MFNQKPKTPWTTRAAFLVGLFGVAGITYSVHAETLGNLSDPTRPPLFAPIIAVDPATEVAPLALSAVFFAADRGVAIINGVRVRVGDSIGTVRVLRIEADHVRVEQDGKPIDLRLIPRDVKEVRKESP